MHIIAHHAEIALKGKNRHYFEKRLLDNLLSKAKAKGVEARGRRDMSRIELEMDADEQTAHQILSTTFGIKNYAIMTVIEPDLDTLINEMRERIEKVKREGHTTIAFATKRADKTFPKNTQQLHAEYGAIANEKGLKVDYSGAPVTLHEEITQKAIYLYDKVHDGPGGLPSGTGGKVLCLFSGGVDSVAAAWMLAKRGCTVELLHLHMLRSNDAVVESKIGAITKELAEWQGPTKLHVAPYHEYQLRTVGAIPQQYDLVGFKHFLLRTAERVALQQGCKAIVTGDALGQVASQTLENLQTQRTGITLPVFSPFIGYDKQEITDLAKRTGLWELAVQDYKDCCSIVSKNAATRTKPEQLQEALENVPFDDVVEKTVEQLTTFASESLK